MRLNRKILFPTLGWFATLLALLIVGLGLGIAAETRAQEKQTLDQIEHAFDAEVEVLSRVALGLASGTAHNPAIQEAFANRDAEALLALTQETYQRQRGIFPITEFQFYLPDATPFLRVQNPGETGAAEHAGQNSIVAQAISTQKSASGIEIEEEGLGIRGVVPINYRGEFLGVLEIGLDLGDALLEDIHAEFGADFQVLLLRDVAQQAGLSTLERYQVPFPALLGYATTMHTPILAEESAYRKAIAGETQTTYLQTLESRHIVRSIPLKDFNGGIIGVLDILLDRTGAIDTQNQRIAVTLGAVIFAMVLGGLGVTYFSTRTLAPIEVLRAAAENIAEGEFHQQLEISTDDELGLLAQAFNAMSRRIEHLMQTLELRVSERTKELEKRTNYLQATAEVARNAATIRNPDTLLQRVALLVNERFQLYHTGIFLLDPTGEYAILRMAAGQSAEEIVAQGVRIHTGAEGIVGHVISTGEPRIVQDTSEDPYYLPNALLPDTRSEMVLPLKVGDRVLGALDVQSNHPNAFLSDELQILQILADQVAIAIENLRLLQENEAALAASRRLYGELSRSDWARILSARPIGYESAESGPQPIFSPSLPQPEGTVRQIPIRVQEKTIGYLYAEKHPGEDWAADEEQIIQLVSEQIAVSLENARILNNLQERTRRDRVIAQITDGMRETLEVDLMLQNVLNEMGNNLNFSALEIRLAHPADLPENTPEDDEAAA
ncbi:MAG: GAF domain-containing protein [Anaerolineae bacterium]|nr:MAG: GAF domain-containing protein [Anaerolineae bacterium]